MGKRKSNKGGLTGLASFVSNAFKAPEADQSEISASTSKVQTPLYTEPQEERPAAKRRKVQEDTSQQEEKEAYWVQEYYVEKYDATGLVPFYTKIDQVPEHLKKYFSQRYRYFSLYSQGCLLDEEGWYSVTPESVADQIAERCRCDTILDAFCGVGGNAIAFARTCQRVIALDTSPTRLRLARHNAQVYGVADRIEFILADYRAFARSLISRRNSKSQSSDSREIDVVFLSPPWGGPSYLLGSDSIKNAEIATSTNDASSSAIPIEAHPSYSLSSIQPIPGDELFRLTRQITPNIAYYLPRNTRLEDISGLLDISDEISRETSGLNAGASDPAAAESGQAGGERENVEVEEEWMGSKLKALTCYFGGLAAGQEHLF